MLNGHLTLATTVALAQDDALPTRDILGVPVSIATAEDAVRQLDALLDRGRPTRVAFLNAQGSNLASADPVLASVLRASLVFNDGIGIDIAARALHGRAFPENLNGTDFVPRFLRETSHTLRVFALGGEPGIAQRALDEFARAAPQHRYIGCHHGYFTMQETRGIVARIRAAQTDVLIVAFGSPLQELWLANNFSATGCRLAFGVGGLLDFVTGAKPRAPQWVRRARFEWSYRLMVEPRRMWKRYLLGNAWFLARVARAATARRLAVAPSGHSR
jgi:exopolysaccharide biosynthesis WecB/TagA/CpsF family protein